MASGIVANAFNVLATEYNDVNCTDATGETRVVAGELFLEGPNDGSCYQMFAGGVFTKRRRESKPYSVSRRVVSRIVGV